MRASGDSRRLLLAYSSQLDESAAGSLFEALHILTATQVASILESRGSKATQQWVAATSGPLQIADRVLHSRRACRDAGRHIPLWRSGSRVQDCHAGVRRGHISIGRNRCTGVRPVYKDSLAHPNPAGICVSPMFSAGRIWPPIRGCMARQDCSASHA